MVRWGASLRVVSINLSNGWGPLYCWECFILLIWWDGPAFSSDPYLWYSGWQTRNSHGWGRLITAINTIGFDVAKDVFQIHRMNEHKKVVGKKRVNDNRKLVSYVASIPVHLVGMGSMCRIKLLGPKNWETWPSRPANKSLFCQAIHKTNKNDTNDTVSWNRYFQQKIKPGDKLPRTFYGVGAFWWVRTMPNYQ